jgi:hypothetical protein
MSLTNRISDSWLAIPAVVVLLLFSGAAYLYFRPQYVEARLRRGVTQALEEHFRSKVELADLHVKVLPRFEVTGHNLTLRYHGRNDVPPLIQIASFSFFGKLPSLFRPVTHIPLLYLQDLQITIPPRDPTASESREPKPSFTQKVSNVVIDRVVCEHAIIRVLPRQSAKALLDWDIHNLILTSASTSQPLQFHGSLTNRKPIGEIHTHGQFGPWNADDPGSTPVTGEYQFTNADLTSLPGIGGVLSSSGT